MDEDRRMLPAADVPTDGTVLVTLRPVGDVETETGDRGGDGEELEAMLIELADGIACYRNYCQHWTDVRIDRGNGATVRNGEIVCEKHGAYFASDTGVCSFGPCEGSVLDAIDVAVRDGHVVLADPEYAFERLGPTERPDAAGGSRIDFTGS
ncbi:Rieske 2Fe-2S domain-containing protein [Halopenitus sp. POP-27]|uniref:Rieske (2Fe-2S) protein n=1 Tax=Halopenitus sp. POP-27 TaxID=2994425 RepID=UPI0024683681|nr:Rieske 2Fe-2S domain-containing protein [Halopenitus sp. POP-27]